MAVPSTEMVLLVVGQLGKAPTDWGPVPENPTVAELDAYKLLMQAGLLEAKTKIQVRLDGTNKVHKLLAVWSGYVTDAELQAFVDSEVPASWRAPSGKAQPWIYASVTDIEYRLTGPGATAKDSVRRGPNELGDIICFVMRCRHHADRPQIAGRLHPIVEVPPMTDAVQAVWDYIVANPGKVSKQIVDACDLESESNFTGNYVPSLKLHGIENARGYGYYHEDHQKQPRKS